MSVHSPPTREMSLHPSDRRARAAFHPGTTIHSLSAEMLAQVLQHVPADQLEHSKLVCRRWRDVIERNRSALQPHRFRTIRFTFDREWQIFLDYGRLRRCMRSSIVDEEFRFYGEELNRRSARRNFQQEFRMEPSCGVRAYAALCPPGCLRSHRPLLERDGRNMQKERFAPFVWRWCERMFAHSTAEKFVFADCFITTALVRQLAAVLQRIHGSAGYRVGRLIVHGCSVVGVGARELQRLFFDRIRADEYVFVCTDNVEEEALAWALLARFDAFRRCRLFHVFGLRTPTRTSDRHGGPTNRELIDAILAPADDFPRLQSLQVPGHKLTDGFLVELLTEMKQRRGQHARIAEIHVDDLEFQVPYGRPWKLDGKTRVLRLHQNDLVVNVRHAVLRTSIFIEPADH
ncbi:hypothetical protein M3Y99_00273800 [Aphelenchoides fujianensis]|nr:hypothetical protein M3Y99_00273800 [Aphelenchoides fujianensis]